ncbi:MAG: hypothetical protein H7145_16240, partial [Akkermansiaceae bacterium]|nr:hypothetical protein [Armatimonadota bacterium]
GGLGQRELTLLNVPLPVMTSALQLTEDQQTRIRTIQDAMAQKRQEMMGAFAGGGGPRGGGFGGPPPGGGGGLDNPPPPQGEDGPTGGGLGGGGNPGDRQQRMQEMRTRMQQLQTEETRSAREIQQLLSEEQKTALAPAMREWNIVQQMGLPLEIAGQLKLTEEQKTILEKQFNTRNGRQGNRQNGAGATRE